MDKGKIHILLIEDNPGDARLVQEVFNNAEVADWVDMKFEVRWFNLLKTGLSYLGRGGYDIVLLDLNLPDSNGLDSINEVQKVSPNIPIIVLSGVEDKERAAEAIKRGAREYIAKNQLIGDRLIKSIYTVFGE